jgi:hypothetical protein
MANSSNRKQALIGWSHNNAGINSNMQLQKFLFFYECFSKIDGDVYELEGLKGYRNGPVFSTVLGDIRYDEGFKAACGKLFPFQAGMVNEKRAKLSDFLAKSLGNKLSQFTHGLNIWAIRRAEIESGGRQVPLDEQDFSEHDAAIFRDIEHAYPESYIDSVDTLNISGKAFVFFKADKSRQTEAVMEALIEAAYDPAFDSPIYASFSETGELLLD